MIALIERIKCNFTKSIQFRLTCYFLFILLPLIAVSLFANFKSQKILQEQTGERTRSAMLFAMEYLDLTMQGIEELSMLIATDDDIIKLLNHTDSQLSPQSIYDFQTVMKQISNIASVNNIISEISILHSASGMMISSYYGGRRIDHYANQEWYQKTLQANGGGVLITLNEDKYNSNQKLDPIFNMTNVTVMRLMDLHNRYSNHYSNMLAITLKKEKLLGLTKNLLTSEKSQVYLFSSDRKLLVSTSGNKNYIPVWDDDTKDVLIRKLPGSDETVFMIRVESKFSKWSLIMIQPEKEIYLKTRQLRMFTYIIIGVSFFLALWISWIVYTGIASPLASLSSGMKQLRIGNLNAKLTIRRNDEFSYLMESFNQMAEEQKHLIRDIYEQQLRLSKTELKFLQSQINPHFLYNTLDSIYWMAKNYDAEEISDMVLNLSRFFRLNLKKGRETFSVSENIEHLQYYIRVQQIRFMDHFTVKFDVSEDSKDALVLKLLLQPIVENAILHGLEKKTEQGELMVSSSIEGEKLKLQVHDNGVGISETRLQYIRTELDAVQAMDLKPVVENKSVNDLFGLRNVKARLKLYYGDSAHLIMNSIENKGTTVTLLIPIERCKEIV